MSENLHYSSPSISLITVTFNAAKVLSNLVESIRQQTDHEFEWVVIDGASTDGTIDIIKSAKDVVTKFISEADFGIYDAINKGIKLATGDYYLVLGADDSLAPEGVELYRRAALETNADLITGAIELKHGIKYPKEKFIRIRGMYSVITSHSVGCLIRKSLHKQFGYYSRRYPIAADTEFLLNSYLNGATLAKIYRVVGKFTAGHYGRDSLGCHIENFKIQVESGSSLFLESILFFKRIFQDYRRITIQIHNRRNNQI